MICSPRQGLAVLDLINKPGVEGVCFSSTNRDLLRWLLLDKPESDDILLLPGKSGAAGMTSARENEIYTGKLCSENEKMHARTL